MMKFSALNESSLSDDNGDPELATREAQEEEAYAIYHDALRKQFESNVEEAEEMFKDLLEMEFLTQAQPKSEKSSGPLGPALTLKYLVYKNLASIAKNKEDYHASISFYLEALEIDATDVMMWFHMGKASINIANYSLARLCFEEGLKCNPNHWPSLDNVISVMYTLNDYANCLYYIAQALEKECYYLKGLAIKDQIYKEDPSLKSFCECYFNKCDSVIHYCEYDKEEAAKYVQECLDMREKKRSFYKPKPLPILALTHPIKEYTWKNLGDSLVNVYDCIVNADPCVSFSCKVDLSPYLENKTSDLTSEKIAEPSPISSLSEAYSSNSTPASCTGQQNGVLQLAPGSQDPTLSEMEVDDASNNDKNNGAQNILLLPQADVQPTDLSLYSDTSSSVRRTKRKRSELAELSDFVSKRRSTRVRNPTIKRPQDNTNYQELLHKFLPPKLIGDGKFDDQDYDSDQLSLDKSSSDHTYGQSADKEKKDSPDQLNSSCLSSSEKEEVCSFIAKYQSNGGVIDLLYNYIVILGSKSNVTWPRVLIEVFCSAFVRLRKHITAPNLFSHTTDINRAKDLAWGFLLYSEFKVDQWYQSSGHSMPFSLKMPFNGSGFSSDKVGNDFYADMEFLVQFISRSDVFGEEWLNFSARALWAKAKFHSLEGEIDLAVCCMRKLNDVLSDDTARHLKITVQNCINSNIIASGNVKQQLESLQRCQSLEEVQRLYEHGDYAAVVDLLVLTFNQPRTSRKQSLEGVPERHAQLLLLQNSLMKLERYKECVYWSEVSFNEALQQFMNATKNSEWSETMAQLLSGLDKCIKIDSSYLSDLEESKLVRLTQNLVLVIVIQMENYDFAGDNAALLVVLPWIILYRLILNEEKRERARSSNNNTVEVNALNRGPSSSFLADFDLSASMPSSLMLLFTAHECLGRRSWCTASDGLLLLTFNNIMMAELQDMSGSSLLYREDLETGLEQCIYCLYGHPNKRSRAKHLQEHNAKQITLTWERAVLIFQYFKPNILPEFDSYRTSTISAELENLFRRISALVPPDEDPTSLVDGYTAYIEGGTDKCPDPPFGKRVLSNVVKDLYYLLGDYYFKNKEFGKAIRFYLCDICVNPDRQDSWAGMALSRSSLLDQKLNSYDLRNESTIYRKASAALRCFEHALELDPTTTSLWIEYGSLAYILHSHASRQLKQETFCDEMYDMLKKKKLEMLEVAERCFRAANHCEDGGEPEEAWLHHYMLGKICEKKGEGPVIFLDHYRKALAYLHEDFARYPQKILYHNPADLSIEALEVYYRTHASCIKYLWKKENCGLDLSIVKIIQDCLRAVKKSPFYTFQEKSKREIMGSSSNAASETEEVQTPKTVEEPPKEDHNYSENATKNVKKLSEESRHSRPSTDSLPESQDLIAIKEIVDSLVSVVAERFIDEAKENNQLNVSNDKMDVENTESKDDLTRIVLESLAEESVYTSKISSDNSSKASPESDQMCQMISSASEPIASDELDDFSKLQELAKELETKAAACEKADSTKENDSAQLSLKEESPASPMEINKDDEVLQSLSSILSSLEAVKSSDPKAQNVSEAQTICVTAETDDEVVPSRDVQEVAMKVVAEVSSSVPGIIEDCGKKDSDDSKCIQSMEISTSDMDGKSEASETIATNKVAESAEADVKVTQDNIDDSAVVTSEKMDTNEVTDVKQTQKPTCDSKVPTVDKDDSQIPKKADDKRQASSTLPAPPSQPTPEELKKSKADIMRLIPKCLDAMRECLQRFPQHYKALYRMAHYYCHSNSSNKNLQFAREILLAATPATKKYPSMSGLFAERKNTNFFNGIWRAPSNEIDRPGSFGAHMYRSVMLLIDVLDQQKDYNMLVNLTQQLHRTPDLGKKYMRDTDRQFLVRKAYDACVNILRDQLNTLLQEEPPPEESRLICCLLEIYRTWMTLVKSSINVEDSNELLEEAYTMYKLGEVDSHPSVLEQAKNFCQVQLGKTYPQVDSSKAGASSKYMSLPDMSSSQAASSIPSASAYNPDAWQKELAESLMMPVLTCEGRPKSETKSASCDVKPINQEPPVIVPSEANVSNNQSNQTPTLSPNSAASPQMVHVEKPKAENLQACSVAFLPVSPAFPKEKLSTPAVFQAPPLLSCQAFECFDVLTSIMQASGYQVAPQLGIPHTFDPAKNQNFKAHQKMQNMPQIYGNFQTKADTPRPGRKRRKRRAPKLEGLNLSKKMHTKPIVSATIANSIAQLKIEPIVTSEKKPKIEAAQSSPLCLVKPKVNKRVPCYKSIQSDPAKGLDLTKKSTETVTSTQCSVIVSASESLKFNIAPEREKEKEKPKTVRQIKKEKEVITDMLPDIYDFTDDSNLSFNLETSRIEKCAKEMLQFMNRKIEDAGISDQGTDISIPKTEMDNIFHILEVENESDKDLNQLQHMNDPKPSTSDSYDMKLSENKNPKNTEENIICNESLNRVKIENNVLSPNSPLLIDNINQHSKDSNTEFTLLSQKPDGDEDDHEENIQEVANTLVINFSDVLIKDENDLGDQKLFKQNRKDDSETDGKESNYIDENDKNEFNIESDKKHTKYEETEDKTELKFPENNDEERLELGKKRNVTASKCDVENEFKFNEENDEKELKFDKEDDENNEEFGKESGELKREEVKDIHSKLNDENINELECKEENICAEVSKDEKKSEIDREKSVLNILDDMPNIQNSDNIEYYENSDSTEKDNTEYSDEINSDKNESEARSKEDDIKSKRIHILNEECVKAGAEYSNESKCGHKEKGESNEIGKDKINTNEVFDGEMKCVENVTDEGDKTEEDPRTEFTDSEWDQSMKICRESKDDSDDSEDITMPVLEVEPVELKQGPSKTRHEHFEVTEFGDKVQERNETKNINYSVLKKDCVVVIRLKDDSRKFKGDWDKIEDEDDAKNESTDEDEEERKTEDEA